uniref:G-protein coupled receptors family 1 profile domain-containing protein n=1 Tax=Cyprinus carpio TaxID=7962 RepID=A0A8C2PVQ2_CYPCA
MSHLACVDLLFTLLLPLKIHYQLNASDWVFGEAACRVISAAYYCNMYCSILLMMCMSVDRLLAVVFPIASLTWRKARKNVCVTCHEVLYHTQLCMNLFSILSCFTLVSYSTIIYVLCVKSDCLATSYTNKRSRAVIMAIAVLMEFVMSTRGSNEEGKYYLMTVIIPSVQTQNVTVSYKHFYLKYKQKKMTRKQHVTFIIHISNINNSYEAGQWIQLCGC